MNATLAHLSDLAVQAAMAGYLVAVVCHAGELASARTRRRVPVPAGGGDEAGDVAADPTAASPLGQRLGLAAVIVTAIGFVGHVAGLVLRGLAAQRGPWGNMYEFTLMITAAAVATWLVVLRRQPAARSIGVYVMTPITLLVFLAGTVLYTTSAPLQPILNVYWLHIHVITISLSSGVLMLSGLASVAYLVRVRQDAAARPSPLPTADRLDRIAYRSAITAFPFYTFAIIAGALWAEAAWGRYWGWDPKETVALASWVVYAGYLHARATAGWRGTRAAWVSVVGLATIVFNLFFVNMVISGLHSYAGLN